MADRSPLEEAAAALLPDLIQARFYLSQLGPSPQAYKLAVRLSKLLQEVCETAEDVIMYTNTWEIGNGFKEVSKDIREKLQKIEDA